MGCKATDYCDRRRTSNAPNRIAIGCPSFSYAIIAIRHTNTDIPTSVSKRNRSFRFASSSPQVSIPPLVSIVQLDVRQPIPVTAYRTITMHRLPLTLSYCKRLHHVTLSHFNINSSHSYSFLCVQIQTSAFVLQHIERALSHLSNPIYHNLSIAPPTQLT